MAPKFEEIWMVVIEQGTADTAIDTMDETIDNMNVIFLLQTLFLGRNIRKNSDTLTINLETCEGET